LGFSCGGESRLALCIFGPQLRRCRRPGMEDATAAAALG